MEKLTKILINDELCNNCGICVQACPLSLFVQRFQNQTPEIVGDGLCFNCGHCVAICPKQAISHKVILPELITPINAEKKTSYEQIIEMIRSRRSIRAFKDEAVNKKDIEKVIQGASFAPSGMNSQSTEFISIHNKDTLNIIVDLSYQYLAKGIKLLRFPFVKMLARVVMGREINGVIAYLDEFKIFIKAYEDGHDKISNNAPCLLLFHANVEAPMAEINASLALQNAIYVCEGLGLGSFFPGIILAAAQNEKKISKLLFLPDKHKIFGVLAIGYPRFKYRNWIQRCDPKITWI